MSKKRLPPRLKLRAESARDGGGKVWVIKDGDDTIRTGCAEVDAKAAQLKLAEYIAGKWAPPQTNDASQVSLADVLLMYLQERARKTKAPRDTANIIARLNEWWGKYKLTQVRGKLCDDYVEFRGTKAGARKDLEILRAAAIYYFKQTDISFNPAQKFTLPEKKGKTKKGYMTRSEAAALLWAALGWKRTATGKWVREGKLPSGSFRTTTIRGQTYHYAWRGGPRLKGQPGSAEFRQSYKEALALPGAPGQLPESASSNRRHLARLIIIGLYTGTRPGAILDLQKTPNTEGGYADLDTGVIFRAAEGEVVASNKVKTEVKIAPRLLAHMKRWDRLDRGLRYWVHYRGGGVEKVNKAWRNCCRDAGLDPRKITPHTLRHTRATWLAQASVDHEQAAASLGMTVKIYETVYCHADPNFQKDAATAY